MKGGEREEKLNRQFYFSDAYFSYSQLWSLVEQVHQIKRFGPRSVLEVGVGNGFVSEFLRTMGINVRTYDINPSLAPDIVASVEEIGDYVEPNQFDLISCCEVLEHMPFESFEVTIRTFSVLSDRLFLTLPVCSRHVGFGGVVQLPKFRRWFSAWLRLPVGPGSISEMHFWEVDFDNETRVKKIEQLLRKYYREVETGLFTANAYHRYFRCSGATGVGIV